MESIQHFLSEFGRFTQDEIDLFKTALIKKDFKRGELLLKFGEVCQIIYFIEKGAFIQYKEKQEIDINIIDLHLPNEWVLNQQSFVKQAPSQTIIEAFSDAVVYELRLDSLHDLIKQSPVFFQLAKLLEPIHSRIELFDNQLTPAEKYQFVLKNRPSLLQVFPLKIIASYLKITPETLSRVREKFSRS